MIRTGAVLQLIQSLQDNSWIFIPLPHIFFIPLELRIFEIRCGYFNTHQTWVLNFYSQQHPIQHVYSKGSQIKLAGCQDKSQYIPYVFPVSMTAREGSVLGFIWRCNSIMEYFGSVGSNAFKVLCSAGLLCPDLKATQTSRTSWCQGLLPVTFPGLWQLLLKPALRQLCCCFLACLANFPKGFSPDLKWTRTVTRHSL